MNEYLKKVEEGIQAQSFARMIGLHAEDAGEGFAVISCEKREDLLQQTGMMHGGVTGAVCEAACGYAALTVLPDGQSLIGVEYKINFLRGITTDKVIAKGCTEAYQPWTKEEDRQLAREFKEGKTTKELSGIHKRTTGAIRSRLKKLELIT